MAATVTPTVRQRNCLSSAHEDNSGRLGKIKLKEQPLGFFEIMISTRLRNNKFSAELCFWAGPCWSWPAAQTIHVPSLSGPIFPCSVWLNELTLRTQDVNQTPRGAETSGIVFKALSPQQRWLFLAAHPRL